MTNERKITNEEIKALAEKRDWRQRTFSSAPTTLRT